jgi:hypothetical protein
VAAENTIGIFVVAALAAKADVRPRRYDNGYLTPNEIASQFRQSIIATFGPTVLDRHVLGLDVADAPGPVRPKEGIHA